MRLKAGVLDSVAVLVRLSGRSPVIRALRVGHCGVCIAGDQPVVTSVCVKSDLLPV